ncbi:MAG: YkvA family protein [Blastocatellia bacterium]
MTEQKLMPIEKPIEKKQARGFLTGVIMLIPNFLKLLGRLFRDSRVPTTEKALLVGAIIYVISPIDLIPDFIPFIGEIDDLYLVSLVLLRLLARTDDNVLREHWDGRGDLISTVDKIVRAAQYILPKRVQRILLGKVVIAPQVKGGLFSSPAVPEDIEVAREKQRRRS